MIDKRTGVGVIFFLIVCITGLLISPCIYAENMNTGIILADDQGNILFDQNREKRFVPASILKILTSLAAIHTLGETHRFSTEYFFDANSNNLYIKGSGDPLFISEVIENLCREISLKTKLIHHIILDQTYFAGQILIPGKGNSLNPYDAPVGALCANFNTIMFKWDSRKNKFVSGEPQTPLLPVFLKDIKKTNLTQGRIILSKQQSLLYPGLLMKYFFEKNNIKITGSVLQGTFKDKERGKGSFISPFEIKEVVQKLLTYSNNYIANQLLLTLGAKVYGTPATLEKGLKAVRLFSKQNLKLGHLTISEGSGISRSNLISLDQMLKILLEFMPYHSLLKCRDNDFFKTGTLSGVRTRAGYILGNDNRLYPYVIMVNQKNKTCESIRKNLLNMVSQVSD
ncbi:D-alanyl-D-alanine carboxypeptidase [Desulfobacula sp.]|uniref:D-alanyl-D-alanine carboxypeptidase/D-alanyl-D-alanine-endopeptidase n=1 Tax=Desulfobacula sp. TaxID=2593537 RepID=UPI0025BEC05D|nr:D-alanyl-D-alanine carboxypeptidase [Desulfobacula sp.]MBC2705964.1 D-alanyl-D-alanine carboxypeptidase [Desulfobacula sp.]